MFVNKHVFVWLTSIGKYINKWRIWMDFKLVTMLYVLLKAYIRLIQNTAIGAFKIHVGHSYIMS